MINIRLIDTRDEAPCNEFHNRIYGTRRTDAQWTWEFGHFRGTRNPFVLAEEDGHIVGTQSLIPILMVDAEGSFLTAKSEETLVDPRMRGRGVFPKMYELLFHYAREHDIHAIWGFTPAVKPFEQVGFKVPAQTSQLFMPLSSRALAPTAARQEPRRPDPWPVSIAKPMAAGAASILARIRFRLTSSASDIAKSEGYRFTVLPSPPAEAAELCHRFVKDWGGVTILRDSDYLQWRYFDNPYVRATIVAAYLESELVGWIAYAIDAESKGYIVDSLVTSPSCDRSAAQRVLAALVHQAVRRLDEAGATSVRAWRINNHPFDALFSRVARACGFYHVRRGAHRSTGSTTGL